MVKFKYNNKVYNPVDLEKKLKKLGITIDDIEIIEDVKEEETSIEKIKLFHFRNRLTGHTITSIYDNLDDIKDRINIEDYDRMP